MRRIILVFVIVLLAGALVPPGTWHVSASGHMHQPDAKKKKKKKHPTPTPAPPPKPKQPSPGTVLCTSSWSNGLEGWAGSKDWKPLGGMLLNDGTNSTGYDSTIVSGCRPSIASYAVQLDVQVTQSQDCCGHSFGVVLRADNSGHGGYRAGYDYGNSTLVLSNGDQTLATAPFDPKQDWHTYRIEVAGSSVRMYVDGGLAQQTTDSRYLSAGRIGLWSRYASLQVRNFSVTALASSPPSSQSSSCASSWSNGFDGWVGWGDWSAGSGMLLSDGTDSTGYQPTVLSSCRPAGPNYAVEMQAQVTQNQDCCGHSFGIVLRADENGGGGIRAAYDYGNNTLVLSNGDTTLGAVPFDPKQDWHTYRVEAIGATIRFYVDGGLALQDTDSRFLSSGRIGLWSRYVALQVRTFTVSALPSSAAPVQASSCQTGWGGGFDGWLGWGDWSAGGGILSSDSSDSTGYQSTILSPCRPSSANYSVQADMRVTQDQECCGHSFGFVVRADENGGGGYRVGYDYGDNVLVISNGDSTLGSVPFDPGTDWHIYRAQVSGNTIRLYVDGGMVLQEVDSRFLSSGRIGLWSRYVTLNVRNFSMST